VVLSPEGIAADLKEFERQRDYPYAQLQFLNSMLQGMPIQSVAAQYQQPSSATNLPKSDGWSDGFVRTYLWRQEVIMQTPINSALAWLQ
jgi:hypothetical protein